MPALLTGVAASGARAPAVSYNTPVDGDALNAASVNTGFQTAANYIAWLQAHAAIFDDANTWTVEQTFNGPAGDVTPALKTTTAPTNYSTIWELTSGVASFNRIMSAPSGLIVTKNCYWDGAQWVADDAATQAMRVEFGTGNIRLSYKSAAANWADGAWTRTMYLDASAAGTTSTTLNATGVTSDGATVCSVAGGVDNAMAGDIIYGDGQFRKAFIANPGTLVYLATVGQANIVNGGIAAGYAVNFSDKYGMLVYGIAAAAGPAFAEFLVNYTVT